MKLKLACGGCGYIRILSSDTITLSSLDREGCPNCNRWYRDFYDSSVGLHDETAISLDDVRAVIREELTHARIVPQE